MSNVVLKIGGRDYSMTCAAGEEAHIAELGQMLHDKLGTLPDGGSKNDSRSLLFAALLLADELHELRKSSGEKPKVAPVPLAVVPSLALNADMSPERLAALAERLEALANVLELAA
jgi:cell division protein ZapA